MAQDRKAKGADRNARTTQEASRHAWAIDSVSEGAASIEHDGDRMFSIPRSLIPAAARDGDVLDVRVASSTEAGREVVTVTVRVDPNATRAATGASARQVKQIPRGNDSGGDVTL